jgi:endo-1,4-beta-D-glucanase Y
MPRCTYCGGTEWYAGPTGGMSTNILCANKACRHWFNFTPEPLNIFDDLKRVEPTDEEKDAAHAQRVINNDEQRVKRRKEGADAYERGASIDSIRVDKRYGTYAEAADNVDRMAGFIDALAAHVRGMPR